MPSTSRIIRILGTLALVALVTPFVFVGGANIADGYSSHVVLSGSMEPAIGTGDVVIIDHSPGEIQQGDIITYQRGDDKLPTTHRVVEVMQDSQERYMTKGDANEDTDPAPVERQQVVGEMVLTVPLIGHVLIFADTKYGFAALVVFPIALLLLNEVWAMLTATSEPEQDGAASPQNDQQPAPNDGEADDGDNTITLTANEVRLALVPTAVLAIYGAWMTYNTRSGIAAALTTSATVCLLLGLALFFSGGEPPAADDATGRDDPDNSDTATGDGTGLPSVCTPVDVRDERAVSMESIEALAAYATEINHCVLWDPDADKYYLPNKDYVYCGQAPAQPTVNIGELVATDGTAGSAVTDGTDDQAAEPTNGTPPQGKLDTTERPFQEGSDGT